MSLKKYAFTDEELVKYAGLLSFLKLTTMKKVVGVIVSIIKKMISWVLLTFGITTFSDLYDKAKENPLSLLEEENREWRWWRQNEGPFENLFRIATYAMPAFLGLWGGGLMLAVDKFLAYKGLPNIESFGKWLDHQLNLGPGDDLNTNNLENVILNGFMGLEKEAKRKLTIRG